MTLCKNRAILLVPKGLTLRHNIVQAQREMVRKQLVIISIVPRPSGGDVQPCSCSVEWSKEALEFAGLDRARNRLGPEPRLCSTGDVKARDGLGFDKIVYNTKASIFFAVVKQSCLGIVEDLCNEKVKQ